MAARRGVVPTRIAAEVLGVKPGNMRLLAHRYGIESVGRAPGSREAEWRLTDVLALRAERLAKANRR